MILLLLATAALGRWLTRSVSDFLAASRCANRYLLTMASGLAGLGTITMAAHFEKFYVAGFGGLWWASVVAPLGLVLALTGFVIYRYRETRALTMAQFFEMRYSRRFRVFCGLLAWTSGLLNYGIFPAVTARFIIYLTGLPPHVPGIGLPMFPAVMAFMLVTALVLTLCGGQIAIMVTDFLQGQLVNIVLLAMIFVMWNRLGWSQLMEGLALAPPGESRLNPFDQSSIRHFNVWFFLMTAAMQVYGFKAWQGNQGYNAAATTPHEARMAGVLAEFRGLVTYLIIVLVPVTIYAMLHLPQFSGFQQQVDAVMATIDSPQIRKQMLVPAAIGQVLPVGVLGMFVAIIIMASVATDNTYLHSWGSIFVQDVVMPFRRKPLSTRAHLWLLRGSIISVAIFAFVFSLLFPLDEYIFMYFQITGAIYLGGAGAVILGGLYWKRGTVEGAWVAMCVGSVLAVSSVVIRNLVWPILLPRWRAAHPDAAWLANLPPEFPFDGVQMAFVIAILCVLLYVTVSLLSRRPPVDMDRLLHRGRFAVESAGHHPIAAEPCKPVTLRQRGWRLLGVGPDFTRTDKAIYLFKIGWVLFFFTVFVVGTVTQLAVMDVPAAWWNRWWMIYVCVVLVVGILTTIWFLVAGFGDLFKLVSTLRTADRDYSDDGTVPPESRVQR